MDNIQKSTIIYNLECSPSYIINNLSQSKDSLYYIHNSQSFPRVLVINKKQLKEKDSNNENISVLNLSERNEMLLVKSIILGLIIGVFIGGIFGWLNSILLYAFGELCTNVKSIKETITDEDD
jgi:hypothetical protein